MDLQERIAQFEKTVRAGVDSGIYPGAVALIGQGDEVYLRFACGDAQVIPEKRPMTLDTRFDLASLTKVTATWPLIMLLLQAGKLQLDTPLGSILEGLSEGNARLTIFDLLTHTSGLKPFHLLYEMNLTPAACMAYVYSAPPDTDKGKEVVYSDNNFILLGEVASKLLNMPLDTAARKLVWEPLGMLDTWFLPPQDVPFAATEQRPDRMQCGDVHDENCASLGSVAGHAGAFSTIDDLAKYCRMLASKDGKGLIEPRWLEQSFALQTEGLGEARGLAFVIYRQHPDGNVIGHTGFTGTCYWVNRRSGLYGILLTNRVHPTRKNTALIPLRGELIKLLFD